jgi:hypothetical protein
VPGSELAEKLAILKSEQDENDQNDMQLDFEMEGVNRECEEREKRLNEKEISLAEEWKAAGQSQAKREEMEVEEKLIADEENLATQIEAELLAEKVEAEREENRRRTELEAKLVAEREAGLVADREAKMVAAARAMSDEREARQPEQQLEIVQVLQQLKQVKLIKRGLKAKLQALINQPVVEIDLASDVQSVDECSPSSICVSREEGPIALESQLQPPESLLLAEGALVQDQAIAQPEIVENMIPILQAILASALLLQTPQEELSSTQGDEKLKPESRVEEQQLGNNSNFRMNAQSASFLHVDKEYNREPDLAIQLQFERQQQRQHPERDRESDGRWHGDRGFTERRDDRRPSIPQHRSQASNRGNYNYYNNTEFRHYNHRRRDDHFNNFSHIPNDPERPLQIIYGKNSKSTTVYRDRPSRNNVPQHS